MKIMLFDLWAGGHNARYLDRFATALADHQVIVVAPSSVGAGMRSRPATFVPAPAARSAPVYGRPEESWDESITNEINLIRDLVADVRPDLLVHMFADHLVDRATELSAIVDTALIVFFPAHHYEDALADGLTEQERARAQALSTAVAAFRASPGARTVFTLDPVAADSWRRSGVPVGWLSEPWVDGHPRPITRGDDILFLGAMAHRKGFDLLVDGLLHRDLDARLVVAGWIEQRGYDVDVRRNVDRLRAAGRTVDLRLSWHDEQACLDLLASARVAVLPYRRHFGMSRVFLESVHCRTPVVVNDFGLLAHLVTANGLGVAVDARDPAALSSAIAKAMDLSTDGGFHQRCERFVADFTRSRFTERLRAGLGCDNGEPEEPYELP